MGTKVRPNKGSSLNTGRPGPNFLFESINNTLADEPLDSQLTDKYTVLIGVGIIASIGIPFNTLCINVLCRKIKKRPNIFKVFTGVIVIATVNLFVLMLMSSNNVINEYFAQYRFLIRNYIKVQRYLRIFFEKSLSSLVILISFNRFIVLLKPMECQQYFVVKHVGKVAIGVIITMSLIVIPLIVDDKMARPSSRQHIIKTPVAHYMTFITVFFGIILSLFLIIINVLLILKFAKVVRNQLAIASFSTMQNAQIVHIGAAIALSAIYLLNAVPQYIIETLEALNASRFGEHAEVFVQAKQISFMTNAFSAACYGPLFIITSRDQRNELFNMLSCSKRHTLACTVSVTHSTRVQSAKM